MLLTKIPLSVAVFGIGVYLKPLPNYEAFLFFANASKESEALFRIICAAESEII